MEAIKAKPKMSLVMEVCARHLYKPPSSQKKESFTINWVSKTEH